MYSVKLKKSLYGLKLLGRMWCNRLREFLLKKEYRNKDAHPCVFIKKSLNGFCIVSIYVDDINIVGTHKEIEEASPCLKTEFEMKDLGKTKIASACRLSTSLKRFSYTSQPT